MLGTQATDGVDTAGRDVEEKRGAQLAEGPPLGLRLQRVDRLGRFDFDSPLNSAVALLAEEDQVRIHGQLANADRRVLLCPRVDGYFVFPLVFRLKDSNDAVVLELLADRPHEDRAHLTSG